MAFAMKMQLSDQIIKKETVCNTFINGEKNGLEFNIQLAYYRGHYLSDIDALEVYVDGELINEEAVTFEFNDKEMPIYKLKYAVTEFWNQNKFAKIRVIKSGGFDNGTHELKLNLVLRVPYMQLGEGHNFMPLDSGETVSINLQ